MSDYPVVALETLKAPGRYSLVGGPFGSKLVGRDYVADGVPVIRGGNLPSDRRFSFDDLVFVTEEKVAADLSGNLAFPGDIVVTQRGTLGQIGLIPKDSPYPRLVVSQSQMKLTVDQLRADPLFVYYVLKSPLGQHEINSRAITAGVPHINLSLFQQLRLPLPPLSIQHKVASVLSGYDDLIEINNRRIKVLEEMAQRIYREWFVEFRFPGNEDVPLVQSELGLVPEGWEVVPVGEVTPVLGGGTPSKANSEYWEEGTVVWYTPTDLTTADAMFLSNSKLRITKDGLARSSARLFPAGSVMMTSRATIGVVSITTVQAATNQGFITCPESETVGKYHLYFWLTEQRELILAQASGATFKEINKATFRRIPFLHAAAHIERMFEERMEPLGLEIQTLLASLANLRSTRDLLLPRLVSGEVDVTDLDIARPIDAA